MKLNLLLFLCKKLVLLVRMKLHVGSSCSRFLWTMIVMDGMKLKSWRLVARLNWCYHEFCCDFCVLIWYGVQIADWQGQWWEVEVPSDVVSCPSPLPLSVTARFCAGHFLLSSVFARCRDDNVIAPVLVSVSVWLVLHLVCQLDFEFSRYAMAALLHVLNSVV